MNWHQTKMATRSNIRHEPYQRAIETGGKEKKGSKFPQLAEVPLKKGGDTHMEDGRKNAPDGYFNPFWAQKATVWEPREEIKVYKNSENGRLLNEDKRRELQHFIKQLKGYTTTKAGVRYLLICNKSARGGTYTFANKTLIDQGSIDPQLAAWAEDILKNFNNQRISWKFDNGNCEVFWNAILVMIQEETAAHGYHRDNEPELHSQSTIITVNIEGSSNILLKFGSDVCRVGVAQGEAYVFDGQRTLHKGETWNKTRVVIQGRRLVLGGIEIVKNLCNLI